MKLARNGAATVGEHVSFADLLKPAGACPAARGGWTTRVRASTARVSGPSRRPVSAAVPQAGATEQASLPHPVARLGACQASSLQRGLATDPSGQDPGPGGSWLFRGGGDRAAQSGLSRADLCESEGGAMELGPGHQAAGATCTGDEGDSEHPRVTPGRVSRARAAWAAGCVLQSAPCRPAGQKAPSAKVSAALYRGRHGRFA